MKEDKEKLVLGEEEVEETDAPESEGSDIESEVLAVIQPCLDGLKEGKYASKEEAIDAMVEKLEAARGEEGNPLGGLGDEASLDLPEDEEVA